MKIVLCVVLAIFACSSKVSVEESPDTKISMMLYDLDSLLNNDLPKNELIVPRFNFIMKKIHSQELVLVYDSTIKYGLDSCAAFGFEKNTNKPAIVFGRFFTNLYPQNVSTAYSILIHEFQHAYDFYTNHEGYQISLGNPIEKEYYEIDAAMLQAIFIKEYMAKYPISPFEVYLRDNLQFGMQGVALFLHQTDLELLHEMDKIKDGNDDLKSAMKTFIRLGKTITDTTVFSDKRPEWQNYMSLTRLITYVFYGQQVAYDIANKKDPRVNSNSDFHFENYPGVHSTILAAQTKFFDNVKYWQFKDRVYSDYNSFFYDAFKAKKQ